MTKLRPCVQKSKSLVPQIDAFSKLVTPKKLKIFNNFSFRNYEFLVIEMAFRYPLTPPPPLPSQITPTNHYSLESLGYLGLLGLYVFWVKDSN